LVEAVEVATLPVVAPVAKAVEAVKVARVKI